MKKSLLVILLSACAFLVVYFGRSVKAQNLVMSNSYAYNLDSGLFKKVKSQFIYKMESRFIKTISKEKLFAAKSVRDIFPKEVTSGINSFHTVSFGILKDEKEKVLVGDDEFLTASQQELIRTTDYASNIFVKAFYKDKNQFSGKLEDKLLIYYLSVVPEKEAIYINGYDSFISYLKSKSLEKSISIDNDKLKSGRIIFTINQSGLLENASIESTSAYAELDEKFLDLIKSMPGTWEPASDGKGEKVSQEFVFFFGSEGC